jgi:hypothetical protein
MFPCGILTLYNRNFKFPCCTKNGIIKYIIGESIPINGDNKIHIFHPVNVDPELFNFLNNIILKYTIFNESLICFLI